MSAAAQGNLDRPPAFVQLHSLGTVTSELTDVKPLLVHPRWQPVVERIETISCDNMGGQDRLAGFAIAAMHQAWTGGGLSAINPESIALLVQTAWGTVDATVDYLDSMLADEGRFASPRHFSRSVYSSVASVAAIHFKVNGPCETLVFAELPLYGLLHQAQRLLLRGRCTHVMLCWVDQGSDIAADFAKIASFTLPGKAGSAYRRYRYDGLGEGAIAVVVSLERGLMALDLEAVRNAETRGITAASHLPRHKPFPLDVVLRWVSAMGEDPTPFLRTTNA